MGKNLTVKKLKTFLGSVAPETKITFGSSRYSMKPLIFNKVEFEDNRILYIHLIELDDMNGDAIPQSEHELRITASFLLDLIKQYPDIAVVSFGSTMSDAMHLNFNEISSVIAIDLVQPDQQGSIEL